MTPETEVTMLREALKNHDVLLRRALDVMKAQHYSWTGVVAGLRFVTMSERRKVLEDVAEALGEQLP